MISSLCSIAIGSSWGIFVSHFIRDVCVCCFANDINISFILLVSLVGSPVSGSWMDSSLALPCLGKTLL